MKRRSLAGKIVALFAAILFLNMLLIISINFYQANQISSQEYDQSFADIASRFKQLSQEAGRARMKLMIEPFNQMSAVQMTILDADELANHPSFITQANFERLLNNPTRAMTLSQDAKRYMMALYSFNDSFDNDQVFYLIFKNEVPRFTVQAIQILQYTFLGIGILSIPTLSFLVIFLRRYSQPIVQMNRIAEHIAEGKFDESVEVNTNDEIGQLAASLNHMATKLKENEASRDAFLAGISHELRTPLTTLKANTTGMIDGVVKPEEMTSFLQSNVEEIDRLTMMVNDLILVSTLEQEPVLFLERTNVSELMQGVTRAMKILADKQELTIELKLDSAIYAPLDKFKMKQVFINILQNAIQHSPRQGFIFIEMYQTESHLRIIIRDQGAGFAPETLAHLFQRFYRDRQSSGLGLGLYISKLIIHAHQGKILAYNDKQGGACIEIELLLS